MFKEVICINWYILIFKEDNEKCDKMSKFQGDYFFDSKYDLRIHIPELFD